MLRNRSLAILGTALVASLAIPSSFAAEAMAASSRANPEVTAPLAKRDPCMGKGSGCAKGMSDGYADGVRCQPRNPSSHANSSDPDYGYGYEIGWADGWKHSECGGSTPSQPKKPSAKLQQRAAGEAAGESDADDLQRCVRSHYRGHSKSFKNGYLEANPYC